MHSKTSSSGLPQGGTTVKTTLVLGIGNILWADEGFGVRAVEAFHETYADHPDVSVRDGGTLGAYLLNDIEEAKRQGKGVVALRGKMIDAPIVNRAKQVIEMEEAMFGGVRQ